MKSQRKAALHEQAEIMSIPGRDGERALWFILAPSGKELGPFESFQAAKAAKKSLGMV